jgi:hypothetical protein
MFNSMLFHEGAGTPDRVAGELILLPEAIFFQRTELFRQLWRTPAHVANGSDVFFFQRSCKTFFDFDFSSKDNDYCY